MQNIQEVFDELKQLQNEQKEIKKEYRDALTHDVGYGQTIEELDNLKEKKKKFEQFVQGQMGKRYERLEELKGQITDLKQMMSDMAVTNLMKGESIVIKDEYDNLYEPLYVVNFKKTSAKADPENNILPQSNPHSYSHSDEE